MEKKQETKKTKSLTQKAKKIRSIIMMTLLCVLMMSAATYAWFTLSNTAKVSNMTMTVGDATGLQVTEVNATNQNDSSTINESDWKGTITVEKFKGILLPAYSANGTDIYEPIYGEEGNVTSVSTEKTTKNLTSSSEDNDEGYYVEYSFWMRAQGSDGGKTKIQLDKGNNLGNGVSNPSANPAQEGTYSLSSELGKNNILPSASVRISLSKDSTTKVFEPNFDFSDIADARAKDDSGKSEPKGDIQQKLSDGSISYTDSNNQYVFELDNNTPAIITLRLWIEGTDPQCGNEIAAKDIITQLKFSTVTGTN